MTEPALRDVFGKFLLENGAKYEDLVVLDSDLSTSTRTHMFAKKFPKRFFNMGVAEQNMLGVAIGFAISGKMPIVSGFSVFTTGRAWEFIRLACHDNLNVKIITTHSGIVGEDGSTHNALEDLSLMGTLPNLNVFVPSDNVELIQMLEYALNTEGPFYIRLPRGSFPKIHDFNYNFSIGEVNVLKDGHDIGIIGAGYGSIFSFQSVSSIEKELNTSIKVINMPCIKPINKENLIKEIKDLNGLIVIEEHNIYCGLGSILARIISENCPIPMKFIGVENSFGESGEKNILLESYGFNIKNLIENVKKLL